MEDDDSNQKQVEAKVLDFNWVFTGDNAERLVKILAKTENDQIFATEQIRVFVDFMWDGFFYAILKYLFIPYCLYFLAFIVYTSYFSHGEGADSWWATVGEVCCLIVFGSMLVAFTVLEVIQLSSEGLGYFSSLWNFTDICSLCINATYIACKLSGAVPADKVQ